MLKVQLYADHNASPLTRLLLVQLLSELARQQRLAFVLCEDGGQLQQAHLTILCGSGQQLGKAPAWLGPALAAGGQWLATGAAVGWLAELAGAAPLRLCAPWPLLDSLRNRFPAHQFVAELYHWQIPLASCAGELAIVDCLLYWLRERLDKNLAEWLADQWLLAKPRLGNERQRLPLQSHLGIQEPKLLEAVALMEANIEEPLATSEIADYVAISRRQLERLFKKYLHQVPSRYYLNLRLDAAHKMLLETNMTIVDIGTRCGFSSGPHFSTAYRQKFDWTPREARSRHLQNQGGEHA